MNDARPAVSAHTAPRWLGVLLIVTGIAGLIAAFALSVERIHLLESPQEQLSCDLNPFLSCSSAMESWQGQLFGFPNPFLGLMAFPAPIIMGALVLGRTAMPRWVWTTFSIGVLGGLVFAMFLAQQSIFVLGFICPWCFLVYLTMLSMAFPLWTWAAGDGALPLGGSVRSFAARFSSWGWVVSLASIVILAVTIMVVLPGIPRFLLGGY